MTTPTPMPPDDARPQPAHAPAGQSAPPATATPAAPDAANAVPQPEIGDRWGTLPTPERCAELEARLAEWREMPDHGEIRGPFDRFNRRGWHRGLKLSARDVFYLAGRSVAGPERDVSNGIAMLRNIAPAETPNLNLQRAIITGAPLDHAALRKAHFEGAEMSTVRLSDSDLTDARFDEADLRNANLSGAHMAGAHFDNAAMASARLDRSTLARATFIKANLVSATLEDAVLADTHLEGAVLARANLDGADLRGAYFDTATNLDGAKIVSRGREAIHVADVRWQGVNLAVVDWPAWMRLGDETYAHRLAHEQVPEGQTEAERGKAKQEQRNKVLDAFRAAARANRQLAAAMRDQGMNDEADHFAYRAQVMQRELYRRQSRRFRAGFSRFLDVIAGYGYKPERSVAAYVLVILTFALAYFTLSHLVAGPPLSPYGAAVFSMTSFHGRGFFPGGISIEDPITGLAALEALCGLIIEVSLIATFTQRFFAR